MMDKGKDKLVLTPKRVEGLFMLQEDIATVTVEEKAAGAYLLQLLSLEDEQLIELREALKIIATHVQLQLHAADMPQAI